MQFLSLLHIRLTSLRKGLICILVNNLLSPQYHLPSLSRLDRPKASPLKNILTALEMLGRERWKSKIATKVIKSAIIQIHYWNTFSIQYNLWEYFTFKSLRTDTTFMLYSVTRKKRLLRVQYQTLKIQAELKLHKLYIHSLHSLLLHFHSLCIS